MKNKKLVFAIFISLLVVATIAGSIFLLTRANDPVATSIINFSESIFKPKTQTRNFGEFPSDGGIVVTVEVGDTVESLAQKYHGNTQEIEDYNLLEAPYTLTVGKQLFIPNGTF